MKWLFILLFEWGFLPCLARVLCRLDLEFNKGCHICHKGLGSLNYVPACLYVEYRSARRRVIAAIRYGE